jgi:adenylate cyclase
MGEVFARLEIAAPGSGPRSFDIESGSITSIGRGANNSVLIEDGSVSRKHAIIDCEAGSDCYLTDAGSRNGTFLNGSRLAGRTRLRHGDRMKIGTVPVTFWLTKADDPSGDSFSADATMVLTAVGHVTVFVADIRDFTGLGRRLGETRLSDVVGTFMDLAGRALDKNGASAQKCIGDPIMAVWNHGPDRPSSEAIRSVLAGAARVFQIAASSQARFELDAPLQLGAGVNTGVAALGNLGSRVAADYTAMGDAVTKAFRFESATRGVNHELIAGKLTWECLDASLRSCFQPCRVTLKGYDEPEDAYGTSSGTLNACFPCSEK